MVVQGEAKAAASPWARLMEMSWGFMVTQALRAAAKLGIADALSDRPKTADEIATTTATHETGEVHQ